MKNQQDRIQRKMQAEAMKESKAADEDVNAEIERIKKQDAFEPF